MVVPMRAKPSSLDLFFALGYVIPAIRDHPRLEPDDNAHAERTKKVGTSNKRMYPHLSVTGK